MFDISEYKEFVEEKIKYITRYAQIIRNEQITPAVINHALSSHFGVMSWLIEEHETALFIYEDKKEEYQGVWDTWYVDVSKDLASKRAMSKPLSNAEIEANVRVQHREEYLRYKRELIILEKKVKLYERLVKEWSEQRKIIIQLSFNSQSEMKSLDVEDYVENGIKSIQEKKVKKIIKQPSIEE